MNAGNEKQVKRLIEIILKRGYGIGVFDGEEHTIKNSKNPEKIFEALDTTGEDELVIRKDGKWAGSFVLIYCNAEDGSEVISDYVDNEVCNEIYQEFNAE